MSTDEWVRRLNALAREMDDLCASIHPTVWDEQTEMLRRKYESLAKSSARPNLRIGK